MRKKSLLLEDDAFWAKNAITEPLDYLCEWDVAHNEQEFLTIASDKFHSFNCDVTIPGARKSGPELLQDFLIATQPQAKVIVITGKHNLNELQMAYGKWPKSLFYRYLDKNTVNFARDFEVALVDVLNEEPDDFCNSVRVMLEENGRLDDKLTNEHFSDAGLDDEKIALSYPEILVSPTPRLLLELMQKTNDGFMRRRIRDALLSELEK